MIGKGLLSCDVYVGVFSTKSWSGIVRPVCMGRGWFAFRLLSQLADSVGRCFQAMVELVHILDRPEL